MTPPSPVATRQGTPRKTAREAFGPGNSTIGCFLCGAPTSARRGETRRHRRTRGAPIAPSPSARSGARLPRGRASDRAPGRGSSAAQHGGADRASIVVEAQRIGQAEEERLRRRRAPPVPEEASLLEVDLPKLPIDAPEIDAGRKREREVARPLHRFVADHRQGAPLDDVSPHRERFHPRDEVPAPVSRRPERCWGALRRAGRCGRGTDARNRRARRTSRGCPECREAHAACRRRGPPALRSTARAAAP